MRLSLLIVTAVGSTGYNLALRQHPSLANPGTYAESVAQLTHGQQVEELQRLCSSLSFHRLAQPEELQLLQQELARMKSEGAVSSPNDPMAELRAAHQLRALEIAEQVAAKAAEAVVAEAAAAEEAAVVAARVAAAEARSAAVAAAAAVAAEAKEAKEAKAVAKEAKEAAAEAAAAAEAEAEAAAAMAAEAVATKAPAAEAPAEAPAEAVMPTGVVMRIGAVARSGAVAPAAEEVAASVEQPISRQPEVAVPRELQYTLQIEREYGRDPRLGPPPPPTLSQPTPRCPAALRRLLRPTVLAPQWTTMEPERLVRATLVAPSSLTPHPSPPSSL